MEIEPKFPSPIQIRTLKELTDLHPHMVAGDPGVPERVIYEQILGLGGERNVPFEVTFPLMTAAHKSQLEKLGITRWRIDRTRYSAQDLATTELNRSKGHVNTDSEIEIFQVLLGRIRMLLQNPKDLSRAWYVDAGLGECVLIPPGWYHSTHVLEGPSDVINLVNREELADWSEKGYGVFQAAYTFARGASGEGIPIVNPVYSQPPSLIVLRSTQLPIIQDFSGSLFNLVHQAPLELLEALAGDILSANANSALIFPQQTLEHSIIQDYYQRLGEEALWGRGYRVIKSYETGGLGSRTFLAVDSSGCLSIVKYSDQEGVDGNGISWLRKQAARTEAYGVYLGQHVPAVLESVEIDGEGDRRPSFFYSMEFRPLETLAGYLLYNPAVDMQEFFRRLNLVLEQQVDMLYNRPDAWIEVNETAERSYLEIFYTDRLKRRLALLADPDANLNPFWSEEGDPTNRLAPMFIKLMGADTIKINGATYPNLPRIIEQLELHRARLKRLEPKRLGLAHGDFHCGNIGFEIGKPLEQGFVQFDLRGVDVDARMDVVYDMGKLAFSFLYALIDKAHALTVPIASLQLNEDTKEATARLEFDASQESRIFLHLQIRTQFWNFLKNHQPLVEVLQKMGEESETWLTRTAFAEAVNLIGVAPDRLKDDPSGSLSLTYYVLTTILLNDFLRSLGIGVEREDYIR